MSASIHAQHDVPPTQKHSAERLYYIVGFLFLPSHTLQGVSIRSKLFNPSLIMTMCFVFVNILLWSLEVCPYSYQLRTSVFGKEQWASEQFGNCYLATDSQLAYTKMVQY